MGLLTIIRKLKQKEKEVRVLVVGLDNAGKTTIVKRLKNEDITTISPTLGFQISTIPYEGALLCLWDVGGQKSLRPYWRNHFQETDGLLWVVDSADTRRLQDCKDELANVLKQEKLLGATLLIFANKQDLAGALTVEEIEEFLQLGDLGNRHYKVAPCSAFTGEGVPEGMHWFVKDMSERLFLPPLMPPTESGR